HIVTCHGSTLLPQFLAMYRVTVESEDTYLLVMRNMFSHRLPVHRKYDLKVKAAGDVDPNEDSEISQDSHDGSVLTREASFKEKVKELPTYKDADFLNSMEKIYVSDEEKEKAMNKLSRDVECALLQFLMRMRIMDYSLLLGIHDAERAEKGEEEDVELSCEEEEEDENDPGVPPCSTSPEGIAGYMSSFKPMGSGEFDPYVDMYAVQSAVGEWHLGVSSRRAANG
ncbi:Phosphatidylinositol 5-phosphate 4-kinase type-2 gamma, partial [Xenoophorus captivus]